MSRLVGMKLPGTLLLSWVKGNPTVIHNRMVFGINDEGQSLMEDHRVVMDLNGDVCDSDYQCVVLFI